MHNRQKCIIFVTETIITYKLNSSYLNMKKEEKQELKREIDKLKKDLSDYLEVYPYLEVSEKEKDRVINQYLDDILNRKKRLETDY